jgi:phage shock protein A
VAGDDGVVERLVAENDRLRDEIDGLRSENDGLKAVVDELKNRVADLESQQKKTSKTSSAPPSRDPNSAREEAKMNRGACRGRASPQCVAGR